MVGVEDDVNVTILTKALLTYRYYYFVNMCNRRVGLFAKRWSTEAFDSYEASKVSAKEAMKDVYEISLFVMTLFCRAISDVNVDLVSLISFSNGFLSNRDARAFCIYKHMISFVSLRDSKHDFC